MSGCTLVDKNVELIAYHKDTAYPLTPDENGTVTFSVPNGEGLFITIDKITE